MMNDGGDDDRTPSNVLHTYINFALMHTPTPTPSLSRRSCNDQFAREQKKAYITCPGYAVDGGAVV